ncbi:MAG: GNAT family N-acetyltransferase [Thalassovita sp.]
MTAAIPPEIRMATPADLAAVDAVLARSYPALLKADYEPSTLVTALPLISRAQPKLLASGSYFVALLDQEVVGAGGWTYGRNTAGASIAGDIRHVVTDHRHVRRGIGRHLMTKVLAHAKAAGVTQMKCHSTRTAVAFYQSFGFHRLGPLEVTLRPGITFPAEAMELTL